MRFHHRYYSIILIILLFQISTNGTFISVLSLHVQVLCGQCPNGLAEHYIRITSICWFPSIQDLLDGCQVCSRDDAGEGVTINVAVAVHIALELNIVSWDFQLALDVIVR